MHRLMEMLYLNLKLNVLKCRKFLDNRTQIISNIHVLFADGNKRRIVNNIILSVYVIIVNCLVFSGLSDFIPIFQN